MPIRLPPLSSSNIGIEKMFDVQHPVRDAEIPANQHIVPSKNSIRNRLKSLWSPKSWEDRITSEYLQPHIDHAEIRRVDLFSRTLEGARHAMETMITKLEGEESKSKQTALWGAIELLKEQEAMKRGIDIQRNLLQQG